MNRFLLLILLTMGWATSVAQSITLKGKISDDETGEAVVGANIAVKGTSKGTSTDASGNFSLAVDQGATLIVSSIGYDNNEVVASSENLTIRLKPNNRTLNEVVVVGYGVQKKANLTGAVTQLKSADLLKRQVGTTSNLLQGLAPGVSVFQGSGKPGADSPTIRIRGTGSIFSSQAPLILVDGVVSSLDNLDANAIESITVLKDAASTAIYGSRAANGVVLVKTKRGGTGGIKVSYNAFVTKQEATNIPEKVSAVEHMELSNVAQRNQTGNPNAFVFAQSLIDKYKTTAPDNLEVFDNDWVKLLLTNSGIMQNHNITVDAGSEKASLFASVSYLNQQGLIPNNSFNRFDLRLNPDIRFNDKLRLTSVLFYNQSTRIEPAGGTPEFIIRQAIGLPATGPAKFGDGMYGDAGQSNRRNPLGQAESSGLLTVTTPSFMGKASFIYTPIKALEIEASAAREQWYPNNKRFQKNYNVYAPNVANKSYDLVAPYPGTNALSESYSTNYRTTFLAQATYTYRDTKNEAKFLLGGQTEEGITRTLGASRSDFINEELPYLSLGGANRDNSGGANEYALAGFYGRLNYAFQDKYLLEVNGRYDGSSRFSQALDKQWGFFPSASAGWVFSNEKFFSGLSSVVSFAKVRASYGTLGNQGVPELYPFAGTYSSGNDYYFNNTINNQGLALTDAINAGTTWEKSTQFDVGVDFQLFKGLSITADYYVRNISNILMRRPIPGYVGLNPALLNLGKMENRGWEVTATYRNRIGGLRYDVTGVLSDVTNKVTELPGVPYIDEGLLRSAEGYALRSYFGYQAVGYFQSKEDIAASPTHFFTANPGDIKYADINGDGKVDANDRTFIGNNFPRYEYSINANFSYGLFDLNLFGQGVGKKQNYISGTGAWPFFAGDFIPSLLAMHKDYWTPENPNAEFPRLLPAIGVNGSNSSFWVKNSAYFRLKNVNLGIRVPETFTRKLGVGSARFYVSGQNLFTITKFWKGFDPEINNNTAEFYPLMKTYTVGLNLKF
jgi:TonB-linked SusC/RagA family outer membrane protein